MIVITTESSSDGWGKPVAVVKKEEDLKCFYEGYIKEKTRKERLTEEEVNSFLVENYEKGFEISYVKKEGIKAVQYFEFFYAPRYK